MFFFFSGTVLLVLLFSSLEMATLQTVSLLTWVSDSYNSFLLLSMVEPL